MFQQKASLYVSTTRMLMVAPHFENAAHQHAVIQLTFSLDGQPFEVWTEEEGWRSTDAVIINSNVSHSLRKFQGWQVTTCIIPDAIQGKLLQEKVLAGAPMRLLHAKQFDAFVPELNAIREQPLTESKAFHSLTDNLYQELTGAYSFKGPLDARILHTLHYIQDHICNAISASALAKEVYLSEDRFLHLFKEQVGAPLRQYILWQRMAAAFKLFMDGKSLKEAALETGFSDPAHFSRTFVQINGMPPSVYADIKNRMNFIFFLSQ